MSLKKEAESLKSQAKEAKKPLSKSIAALEKAVGAKDRQVTMQEANQITLIAADLSEPFHPQVPVDIARLDYYGRELELWSAVKNEAKLKEGSRRLEEDLGQGATVRERTRGYCGGEDIRWADAETQSSQVTEAVQECRRSDPGRG